MTRSIYQYTKTGHRRYDVYLDISVNKVYHRTFIGAVAWSDGNGRPYSRGWTMTPARDPYPDLTRYEQKHNCISTTTTREEAAGYCATCWFLVRSAERKMQS